MYKLIVGNKHNGDDTFHWCYDEKTGVFLNQDKETIDILCPDDKYIIVRITPGMECNNSCVYCQQEYHRKETFYGTPSVSYIEKYCQKLYEVLEANFTDLPDYSINFSFWGGEPLLYFSFIQKCISYLKEVFKGYNTFFSMITNGILLDDFITEYTIENNINLTLSHDGPGQLRCRNIEILENDKTVKNIIDLIQSGEHRLYFAPVFSKYNPSVKLWTQYMRKYIGDAIYFSHIAEYAYMRPLKEDNIELRCSKNDIENNRNDFITYILNKQDNDIIPFKYFIDNQARRLIKTSLRPTAPDVNTACLMSKENVFSIDLKGTVWKCHNYIDYTRYKDNIVGNIFIDTVLNKHAFFCDNYRRRECYDCLLNKLCNGGCPMGMTSPADQCYNKYNMLLPAFYNMVDMVTSGEYQLLNISRCADE